MPTLTNRSLLEAFEAAKQSKVVMWNGWQAHISGQCLIWKETESLPRQFVDVNEDILTGWTIEEVEPKAQTCEVEIDWEACAGACIGSNDGLRYVA